ncbi:hypothetical protein ACWDZ4_20630 [Streptomyces sp. NPDC003016]
MAWDGIPWFVEGTAASEETVRLLAEVAAGGGEGIIGPADLVVTALDAPADAVQLGPGAMVARRRAPGAASQAYAARMPVGEQVDIAPTGADGPRSDLVVARIEDPYGGELWPEPADPTIGPYVFTRVISDVTPGTRSILEVDPDSTAVTLARIDLPENTSAVTQEMVTDLRQLARPRAQTTRQYLHSVWATPDDLGAVTDVWEDFPLGARWQQQVPEWATHLHIHALATGILHPSAVEARGQLRVVAGEQSGAGMAYQVTAAGRVALQAGHSFVLDPADRGRSVPVAVQGIGRATSTGLLQADTGTALSVEITFSQLPVIPAQLPAVP